MTSREEVPPTASASAPPSRRRARAWEVAGAVALVAAAWWLRDPQVRYLLATAAATLAVALLTVRLRGRGRRWALPAAGALSLLTLLAAMSQRELGRIETAWPAQRAALAREGERALVAALDETVADLRDIAARAVAAPGEARAAFDELAGIAGGGARGVVLYSGALPLAWDGRVFVTPRVLGAPLGAIAEPFYVALQAEVAQGSRRAVATAVVHAEPPADSLVEAADERVARRTGLTGFELVPAGDMGSPPSDARVYAPLGDSLLVLRAVAPQQAEARVEALRRARARAGLLLALSLVFYVTAAWRRPGGILSRLLPLGVAIVCVALVPLNQLSTVTFLFDPAVYFATVGGPFTSSVGALILSGAIVLLAMFVALRAHARPRARSAALALVLAAVAGGPFLLRVLSRGVTPPIEGIATGLWLAWEVALFLAASVLLLAAATAGSALLGPKRGLHPAVAPALAVAAAALAPVVLQAPARWPDWYVAAWIAAIAALALTRRHRWVFLAAALVAALGATTLAWRADVGARVALAAADVSALGEERPEVRTTLARLGDVLADGPPLVTDAALLRAFASSDLEGSGFPVALATAGAADAPLASVSLAPLSPDERALAALRRDARAGGEPVVRLVPGIVGTYGALAVPFADGSVTTVLVGPRTRLIRDDPDNALLGIAPRDAPEAPYALTLAPADSVATSARSAEEWHRAGDELHGHRVIGTGRGLARAQVIIELRPLDVLVQRGALVVLFDLLLIVALWTLSASPDRAFGRWLRARGRRWGQSYRLRLTLALFGFFVIPALAFAAWSWRQLLEGDLQGRELLVREALRTAASEEGGAPAAVSGVPLLAYRRGELRASSEPVLELLAPTGRLVPPAIQDRLTLASDVEATRLERVGDARVLFGYRAMAGDAERMVLAAPAPRGAEALGRRRRDLGVLVAFATVVGGLAALWLSGVAARSLAEPIGRLRGAAIALAEGTGEPPLPLRPPAEFVPVFSAFRHMARDIRESRAALEEAERRTRAVLRDVASGVVAVDAEGLIVLANPHAERLLDGALVPRDPLAPALPPALRERLAAFLRAGDDEVEFDLAVEERQLHARLTRLTTGGGGAVLTLDDVTELARAQRVLAWGEMARQVAHEIKNPLTPIRLGVQHLQRARADARADFDQILDRNVARILAEIDRLDQIARGFSRYGMAPAEREAPEPTDLAALARDVVELERMGHDGVRWMVTGADVPRLALARDAELREVLLNVLENSRLAGARTVTLHVGGADVRATLEVRDDGHGIPAHLVHRIFEPHFSTRTSGSGLGLAITRQLIEAWGGEIAIESAEGEGTTVRIALPAA